MSRRMVDDRMWRSRKFKMMPPLARLMQISLINKADDQGRCMAHPDVIRSDAFLYEDVSTEQIQVWLDMMVKNGTILLYQADGEDYLQFLNWWNYQTLTFAKPSDYPAPEGWQDRIRCNGTGNITLTHNWVYSDGKPAGDTCDANGNPLPFVAQLPRKNHGGRPSTKGKIADLPAQSEAEKVGTFPSTFPSTFPGGNVNKDQYKDNTREEEEGESNNYGASAPPPAPFSFQAAKEEPLIKAYHDLYGSWPTKAQMQIILDARPLIGDWVRGMRAWAAAGHNPTNVQGMLDYAFEPSRYERAGHRPPPGASGSAQRHNRPEDYTDFDDAARRSEYTMYNDLLAPAPKDGAP